MVGTTPKTVYASTETLACSVPSIQYPLGFIFDWRQGIVELHPKNKGEINQDSLRGLDEAKIGEIYQIVYTSLVGELTKYILDDEIKCVAKGDDVLGTDQPVFKFHTRTAKTISLQNFTRISEDELISGFKDTKLPFIDFIAKVEVQKSLEYLVIYLEHSSKMMPNDIAKALHMYLYTEDQDYKNLVDNFEYFPINIRIVPTGTFACFLETIPAGSVPKIDRIDMTNDFNRLLQIIDERGGCTCSTM